MVPQNSIFFSYLLVLVFIFVVLTFSLFGLLVSVGLFSNLTVLMTCSLIFKVLVIDFGFVADFASVVFSIVLLIMDYWPLVSYIVIYSTVPIPQ